MVSSSYLIKHTVFTILTLAFLSACGGGGGSDPGPTPTPAPAPDTAPDSFSFTAVENANRSSTVSSNTVTITGINRSVDVTIVSGAGRFSVAGGDFVTTGTISNDQTLQVQLTTEAGFSAESTLTLDIGGVQGGFTATTLAQDVIPNAFTFTNQNELATDTAVLSAAVTIEGINDSSPVTLTGEGTLVIDGSDMGTNSTIINGQSLRVSMTTSGSFETGLTANVNIGGDSGLTRSFTATTAAQDLTPADYSFVWRTNADPNTVYTSNEQTITGITGDVSVAVSSSTGSTVSYSINSDQDADFTQTEGTVQADDVVRLRVQSAAEPGTGVIAALTVGTETRNFSVTTSADTTSPETTVAFPTLVTLTEGTTLTVRGSASDDFGPVTSINLVVTDSLDNTVDDVTINTIGDEDYSDGWSAQVDLGADTVNTITILATDNAGNQETSPVTLSVTQNSEEINFPIGETTMIGNMTGREISLDKSDPDEHRLILPQQTYRNILGIDVNTGDREIIIPDDDTIELLESTLAIPGASQFYFGDSTSSALYRSTSDGYEEITSTSTPNSNTNIGTPIGMALKQDGSLLYVVDGEENTVYSVDIVDDANGIGGRTLISGDNLPADGVNPFVNPSDLVLDADELNALVVDTDAAKLVWVNLATGVRTDAANATGLSAPRYIEKYSDERAILTDWGTAGQLLWVDLTDDGALTVISDDLTPTGGANQFNEWPISVAVDTQKDIAYVATGRRFVLRSSVKVVDLTTGERVVLTQSVE